MKVDTGEINKQVKEEFDEGWWEGERLLIQRQNEINYMKMEEI